MPLHAVLGKLFYLADYWELLKSVKWGVTHQTCVVETEMQNGSKGTRWKAGRPAGKLQK